jgi:hypothetical protein
MAQGRGLARRAAGHEAVNARIDLASDEAAEGLLIDCAAVGERRYEGREGSSELSIGWHFGCSFGAFQACVVSVWDAAP